MTGGARLLVLLAASVVLSACGDADPPRAPELAGADEARAIADAAEMLEGRAPATPSAEDGNN